MAERGVLARHLRRVELRLVDVLVDAGDVVVGVGGDRGGERGREARRRLRLLLEVGLGVGRDLPLLLVLGDVGAAGEAREAPAAGVAQRVHEEQAILGGDVAEAEHRAVARLAVHVRDAEALVAQDRDVRARGVAALDLAGGHAEARVLEVLRDARGLQPGRRVHEVAVHPELVAAVRLLRPGGEEGGELRDVVEPARARGEDVAEALAVVGLVRLRLGPLLADRRDGRDGRDDRRDRRQLGGRGGREEAADHDGQDAGATHRPNASVQPMRVRRSTPAPPPRARATSSGRPRRARRRAPRPRRRRARR